MAIQKQDFQTYSGNVIAVVFTVLDAPNGNPVSIANVQQITWTAQRSNEDAVVITKTMTGGGITLPGGGTDGRFRVLLAGADTSSLSGNYLHVAAITDSSGAITTVETGTMNVGLVPVSTYSGDPRVSDKDAVRFWVRDTDPSNWLLSDQEILYTLTLYGNALLAAAGCARSIAGKYATKVNKRVGDLAISYTDLAKNFFTLADELEAKGSVIGLMPYAGGISVADMQKYTGNSDVVQPDFTSGQFDNSNATQTPFNAGGSQGT